MTKDEEMADLKRRVAIYESALKEISLGGFPGAMTSTADRALKEGLGK